MVASNLKAETIALMDQRSSLETQIDAIIERLCRPGGPGLAGNLIDPEGFPRSDIDIPSILSDRHRLAELQTDYSEITRQIDRNLGILHSIMSGQNGNVSTSHPGVASGSSHDSAASMDVEVEQPLNLPFAVVDEITDGSPASEDGMQLGDQIVKFGGVENGDQLLSRLASETQLHQGNQVPVLIMRHGSLITLNVTPRSWNGRGLLGCHFRIL